VRWGGRAAKKELMASKKPTPRTTKQTGGGQQGSAKSLKPKTGDRQRSARDQEPTTDTDDVAEAVLEALAATVVADGTFSPAEKALLERFSKAELFEDVSDKNAVIKKTIDRCAREGLEDVLRKAAARLPSSEDRETAFTACFAAAVADGKVTSSELRLIELLRTTFGLSVRRAKELTAP
jgi:tellurite resistance protein